MEEYNNEVFGKALDLIKNAGTGFNALKAKGLGLNLILLALAEVQSKRICDLSNAVLSLEHKVFNKDVIANLDPNNAVGYYNMASKALDSASDYIKQITNFTDWELLESQLVTIAEDDNPDVMVAEAAKFFLKKVVKLNFHGLSDQQVDRTHQDL